MLPQIARPTVAWQQRAARAPGVMHSVESVAEENASYSTRCGRRRRSAERRRRGWPACSGARRRAQARRNSACPQGDVDRPLRAQSPESESRCARRGRSAGAARDRACTTCASACRCGLRACRRHTGGGDRRRPSPRSARTRAAAGEADRAGDTLIEDSYNANPDSVRAATTCWRLPGPTALVLGDMGEVGTQGPEFHAEVGRYAKEKGIDVLLAVGSASKESASRSVECKALRRREGNSFQPETMKTILVKGSRFMKMERIAPTHRRESKGPLMLLELAQWLPRTCAVQRLGYITLAGLGCSPASRRSAFR